MNRNLEKRLLTLEKAKADRDRAAMIERAVALSIEFRELLRPSKNDAERHATAVSASQYVSMLARDGRLRDRTREQMLAHAKRLLAIRAARTPGFAERRPGATSAVESGPRVQTRSEPERDG